MKFQVGDKVLVRHSNEEGEVVDIINDQMVMVEVKGVRFPAYSDQIEFPYFKRFTEKKEIPTAKPKPSIERIKPEPVGPRQIRGLGSGVWLSFLPVFDKDVFDDDVVDYFKVYLVNQTPDQYNFDYWLRLGGATDMELSSTLLPNAEFYLQNVPLEKLNDKARFDFDFSLFPARVGRAEHFEASHKVKAKQLFQKLEGLRKRQEATFSDLLFDKYPDAPYKEPQRSGLDLSSLQNAGYKVYDAKQARQHLEPARTVIDLHIEKLTDSWSRMNPGEMLDLQLRTFEKYYELAIAHHQPSLTVIHGVGTGRLREDIHEILSFKKEVKSFVNQYLPAYGYGATEIYFK